MGQLDINKISEDVVCGLFRELYGFQALRNLNSAEKENYPGIDLADDDAKIAIQVTSDKSLTKLKDTLRKVIQHGLHTRYDRIIVYNLTHRQQRYSEAAIFKTCGDKIRFSASSDILDFRSIASKAAEVEPQKLQTALNHLSAYMRGSRPLAAEEQANVDKLTINAPDSTLADEKILHQLKLLRISRQFAEYDRLGEARRLAERCTSGQLASGSFPIRSRALAWCARVLSNNDLAKAEDVLRSARHLSAEPEVEIAEAFLIAQREGWSKALSALQSKSSPQATSAALFIVANSDGKPEALEWFRRTGTGPNELDSDGKNLLLDIQLEQRDWIGAAQTAGFCNGADCEETPILLLTLAFEALLKIVPEELRPLVHAQLPFQMATCELASGEEALKLHREAQIKFGRATERFFALGMSKAAEVAEGYELWLALTHPELKADARVRLRSMLHDPARSLRLVPLALNFGVELDLEAVERAVDRQVALSGGSTGDTAVARLSLALTQSTQAKVASYIERYRSELELSLDPRAIAFIEIEMLSESGQVDAAQEAFEKLEATVQLGPDERARLKLILSEGTTTEPTAARRVQYEQSKSLTDLKSLVDALYDKEEWSQLTEYAARLHDATKSLPSAEQLVAALVRSGRDEDAIHFIEANKTLLVYSNKLRTLKCWALYRSGRLSEARQSLLQVSVHEDAKNWRLLRRNIAAASGDWQELAQIVGDELANVDKRSPEEIIQAAYLGFQVHSPAAQALLFAAVENGSDDPQILAGAYFLATNAGLEDDPEITGWLHRAAQLSGEDGPIQTASLEEILALQPHWKDRHERTWRMLRNGEVPMFMAAQSLNRSLIEMIAVPLLANMQEDDPRRRIPIYAFSGKRAPVTVPLPNVVGLDASALLTLGGLGLLGTMKATPFKFRIPHSTLLWLFDEGRRAAFHQPSRFQRAQKLQDLIAAHKVAVLPPGSITDSRLTAEVGEELAGMICEAEALSPDASSPKKYVVRSAPVRRLGLVDENVDLGAHKDVLVSCQTVVEKLRDMGRLTSAETKRACDFLQLNEQKWPEESVIENCAILLLDDLSVSYLQSCKLLEKVVDAGFTISISESFADENRQLLSLQRMSSQLENLIEDIRAFLRDGIEAEAIVVDPLRHTDDGQDEHSLRSHPTFEAFMLSENCDVVVFDDRFINQHQHIVASGQITKPIITSPELLELCVSHGCLDAEQLKEAVTNLRRGGFLFLELNEEELFVEISACMSEFGTLKETAEIRAIREAFIFSRLTRALRHEDETPWLDRSIIAILKVYRRIWSSGDSLENVTARAGWLLDLADMRGWLVSFPYAQARHILHEGRIHLLMFQVAPPLDMDQDRQEAFLKWIDERLVVPLRREFPELFDKLVQVQKNMLLSYLDRDLLNGRIDDGE